MGNLFSVRILGVDGEIWVINQQKIKARNTIQRFFKNKNLFMSFSANFPHRYTVAYTKQLGPTCCDMHSKPKTYEKFLLGFPTMKNMGMSMLDFLAVDFIKKMPIRYPFL
jgi:hypothetical protein